MDSHTFNKLTQSGIAKSKIDDMDFAECNLSKQDLIGCDLRGFAFTKVNLEKTLLIGCDLRGIYFVQSSCVSAQFQGADLRGANLAFGYFHNADFRGADLRGAILNESQCNECNFSGADLRGATLGFDHYKSDFRGADLRGIEIPDDANFVKLMCDIRGALLTPKNVLGAHRKRTHPRVRLSIPFQVFDKTSHLYIGGLIDLSRNGFKLMSEHQIDLNKQFSLHILVPGGDTFGARLEIEAKSIWSRHDAEANLVNTGFHIETIGEHGIKIINEIMKKYIGASDQRVMTD